MATMEGGSNFDPTAVCSVCLLPFVGRQPKILPCFHTFCLPCLTSMPQAGEGPGADKDAQNRVCITAIACPTCNKVVPVPTSGVANFQAANGSSSTLEADNKVESSDGVNVSLADDKFKIMTQGKHLDDFGPYHMSRPERDIVRECLVGVGSALQAACDNLLAQTNAPCMAPVALMHLTQTRETVASNAVLGTGNHSMAVNNLNLQCSVDLSRNRPEPFNTYGNKQSLLSKDTSKKQALVQNNMASIDVVADCTQLSVTGFSGDVKLGNTSLMASVSGVTEGLQAQLDSVLEKIAFLENRVHILEADNASLRHMYLGMSREVTSVRDKNVLLCQNVGLLLTENAKFNRELARLHQDFKAETASLEQEFVAQSSRICNDIAVVQTFFNGFQDLHRPPRVAELPDVMGNACASVNQVAFNAWLKESVTTTVEQTLVISKVTLNVGEGYNPHTGTFTAPMSGTYLFIFTIWSGTSQNRSGVFIVLENEVIGGACTANENSCTGYSVAHVSSGQKVWLRTLGGEEISIECGSTFGGLLIQAEQ
ncbi:uncharacterized protein LOC112560013 isoform X2 [Pomacea canaliculata]|uniref:uncharacterized protein LOC112560013 isoform X2 n=1 Tax=Pomacea canaliculata TaxID=400727 RepID=UPI000D731EF2|nr:uncharacterized protein LOC112560013 isoform X2 [Pomacea canaliculata]